MKKTCDICGGTGQIGYFKGVSRFLLSWDECPECAGTGQLPDDTYADDTDNGVVKGNKTKKGSRKK